MTMIIVEGPDNSGKTTLVKHLASTFGLPVVVSIFDSRKNYDNRVYELYQHGLGLATAKGHYIFDRCTVISEEIYGPLLRGTNDIYERCGLTCAQQLEELRKSDPLIIYCRPSDESIHNHGDREQMEGVIENSVKLVERYDRFFDELMGVNSYGFDFLTYNYELPNTLQMVEAYVANKLFTAPKPQPNFLQDIADFHEKFGLKYDGAPRNLPQELAKFRARFMREEIDEWDLSAAKCRGHLSTGNFPSMGVTAEHLAQQLDALVDEFYVVLGTAYMQGFTPEIFHEAWRRVHRANMSKIRAERAEDSKRGSTFDVVKPAGWVAPDHFDLVKNHAHRPNALGG